jgi:hypothetical protein
MWIFLENLIISQLAKTAISMEPRVSMCSKKAIIGSYPEPVESSPQLQTLYMLR